jgi:DNA-binding CsgD family transcriptional regulator/PAS domain-containing protein
MKFAAIATAAFLMPETRLDHLIGLIYDAAAAPELWPAALAALGDAVGGGAFVMSILSPSEGTRFAATVRIDPEYQAMIEQRFATAATNPLIAAMPRLPCATPVAREAILPDPAYLGSALYNEVFRPQRLAHAGAACLLRTPEITAPLGIIRPVGSERPNRRDLDLLQRLLPHMQRAVQLYLRLAALGARGDAAEEALGYAPFGVILVDAGGKVLFLNPPAEAIVAAADGLTISNGMLSAATASETRALAKLVAQAAATGAGAGLCPGGAMALSRRSSSSPLPVLVTPLPRQQPLLADRRPAAAVFLAAPERCAPVAGRRLVELFGLTPAEAQLAVALLAGKRLRQIASERSVQLPTVRNQLRAVLAKTGTARQADLVRLLATLPAAPTSSPGPQSKISTT